MMDLMSFVIGVYCGGATVLIIGIAKMARNGELGETDPDTDWVATLGAGLLWPFVLWWL